MKCGNVELYKRTSWGGDVANPSAIHGTAERRGRDDCLQRTGHEMAPPHCSLRGYNGVVHYPCSQLSAISRVAVTATLNDAIANE